MLSVVLAAVTALAGGPTGREWEDHTSLSCGKLPAHAWFGTFPTVEGAKRILANRSPRHLSLDSETDWRFRWSRRPSERPSDFWKTGFDVSDWDVVKVPCSWQASGIRASRERFGLPIYVNQPYIFTPKFPDNTNCWPKVTGHALPKDWTFGPDDNPVGSYRRDFEIPADWMGDEIVLQFDGVESFFYLWVNGTYVGFAKDSRSPAAFDVTKFVRAGRNTVAVEVYRNCDGSYLECQDIYRLSGIFRPVSVFHRPKTHIRDVSYTTAPRVRGDYSGDWTLALKADWSGQSEARVRVFDAEDREVLNRPLTGADAFTVKRPRLWSAEEPNLYTLVVSLERDGACVDAAGFQLGFRQVEIRDEGLQIDRTFLFNGQPVKLKGVNRGECDPDYGHFVPDSRLEEDIRLIKRGNFNHIRNSHFPQGPYFYYLCNKYGIYVMDEANLESHGLYYGRESISYAKSWEKAHVARMESMYEWGKNQPCTVIWSMGNEAGPGDDFKACYAYLTAKDPTRPVQYERNNWITDMGSRQYPSVAWFWQCARGEPVEMWLPLATNSVWRQLRYPYHVNEYAHNFNNGCGNLADFQEAIESSTRICGGALWDWADQSLTAVAADGRTYQIWGGCLGEKPEEGQGILDGIVTANRTPEPGYYEAKHVFQPVAVTGTKDALRFVSKHYFRDTSAYDCRWELLEDGVPTASGRLAVTLAPQEVREVALPEAVCAAAARSSGEVSVRVSFVLKEAEGLWPKGWIIAEDLVVVRKFAGVGAASGAGAELVWNDGEALVVRTGKWLYGFSKSSGQLVSLRREDGKESHECLRAPMALDCFRVPTGGETHCFAARPCFGRLRAMDGLRDMRPTLRCLETGVLADGTRVVWQTIGWRGARKEDMPSWAHGNGERIADLGPLDEDAPGFVTTSVWRFGRDGRVSLKSTFEPTGRPTEVQRVGWRLVLDEEDPGVSYFACGPFDNYSDRKTGCLAARYEQKASRLAATFTCSQDGGNREEARYVSLGALGLKVSATTERLFAFALSPYSPTELIENQHPELLMRSDKTEFGIYARVRGLGSANCGPLPLARDRIAADEVCELDVTFE